MFASSLDYTPLDLLWGKDFQVTDGAAARRKRTTKDPVCQVYNSQYTSDKTRTLIDNAIADYSSYFPFDAAGAVQPTALLRPVVDDCDAGAGGGVGSGGMGSGGGIASAAPLENVFPNVSPGLTPAAVEEQPAAGGRCGVGKMGMGPMVSPTPLDPAPFYASSTRAAAPAPALHAPSISASTPSSVTSTGVANITTNIPSLRPLCAEPPLGGNSSSSSAASSDSAPSPLDAHYAPERERPLRSQVIELLLYIMSGLLLIIVLDVMLRMGFRAHLSNSGL